MCDARPGDMQTVLSRMKVFGHPLPAWLPAVLAPPRWVPRAQLWVKLPLRAHPYRHGPLEICHRNKLFLQTYGVDLEAVESTLRVSVSELPPKFQEKQRLFNCFAWYKASQGWRRWRRKTSAPLSVGATSPIRSVSCLVTLFGLTAQLSPKTKDKKM